jgi:hypothetical protein
MIQEQDDPWAWMNQQKPVAPLAAAIAPSQEQAPPSTVKPDTSGQQLAYMATPVIDQAIIGGYKGYQAANTAAAASQAAMAPLSANAATGVAAPAMSVAPAMATPAAAALTEAGLMTAAPAMSTAAGTALGAGGTAAAAPLAATGAVGAAGAGAMAGGQAALAAMGPVGWAIGAGLLAKQFGLF